MPPLAPARYLAALVVGLVGYTGALAQPQALPPERLKAIKAATVYLKVELTHTQGNRSGSGSGFVVRTEQGVAYVVTNDHVVTPPFKVAVNVKPTIEAIFLSGTKDEWTSAAEVVARDPDRDLALLVVRTQHALPEPLAPSGPTEPAETTPVYVCGFPFGKMLAAGEKNPEISVGLATVSSLRANDRGEVVTVQLNGALNPGNSGGPVVTTDGKLVGVAVRTVIASGIGEAVPHTAVAALFAGRLADPALEQTKEGLADGVAVVQVRKVDPFKKVKSARGFFAPIDPKSQDQAPNVSKLANVETLKLAPVPDEPNLLEAPAALPKGATHVWIQAEWTDTDNKAHLGSPVRVKVQTAEDLAEVRPDFGPWRGPIGPDSRPLPPLAAKLPPNPPNQPTLIELNADPDKYLNKPVTVDVLVRHTTSGKGRGPALEVRTSLGRDPECLHFTVNDRMATLIERIIVHGPVAMRVRGEVQATPLTDKWRIVEVNEIGVFSAANVQTARITRAETRDWMRSPGSANVLPTPDAGLRWVRGPDGKTLPPLATKSRGMVNKPGLGEVDLPWLNENIWFNLKQIVTTEAVIEKVTPSGMGDGPSLTVRMPNGEYPPNVNFVLEADMARQLSSLRIQGVLVRIHGMIRKSSYVRPWALVDVQNVYLIGLDGSTVLRFKSSRRPSSPIPEDGGGAAETVTRNLTDITGNPEASVGKCFRMRLHATGGIFKHDINDPMLLPVRGFKFREFEDAPVGHCKVSMWSTPELAGAFTAACYHLNRFPTTTHPTPAMAEVRFFVMRYDKDHDTMTCCATRFRLFDEDGEKLIWEYTGALKDFSPEGETKLFQFTPPQDDVPRQARETEEAQRLAMAVIGGGVGTVMLLSMVYLVLRLARRPKPETCHPIRSQRYVDLEVIEDDDLDDVRRGRA